MYVAYESVRGLRERPLFLSSPPFSALTTFLRQSCHQLLLLHLYEPLLKMFCN
jgi:ABC-type thiamine transport system ATPase subunit